ncbi:MAG: zinc-binding dehydrogenase [Mycobacteriales bacterium]
MRAVWLTAFGPPEVLVAGEAPDPEPGDGQVLVETAWAGVTFVDTMVRAGRSPQPGGGPELPVILGNAVGGVVSAGAPDLVGRVVVASLNGRGGYAERAVAAAEDAFPVPDGLEPAHAVALLADGRTAVGLTTLVPPEPGQRVLVEAAAGGVGSLLVQLAAAAGAHVIAAASSAAKLEQARGLGAADTVNYAEPDWPVSVGGPVDLVYDGVGGEIGAAALELVAPGGRFATFGLASGTPTDTAPAAGRGVALAGFEQLRAIAGRRHEFTRTALAEAAAGRLKALVGHVHPLERADAAHRAIEARQVYGKALLFTQ